MSFDIRGVTLHNPFQTRNLDIISPLFSNNNSFTAMNPSPEILKKMQHTHFVGTHIFFEKIACAETAEPRMTVSYTTNAFNAMFVDTGVCGSYTTPNAEYYEV